jgi:uncharacterized protein
MSTRNTYPPGVPCWVAVLAPDIDAACAFYAAIFDWSFDNIAAAGDPPFYIASLHGDRVAGLFGPDQPATWITAVSVRELDVAVSNATRAGGTAPGESIEIPTLGRFHRLHDPAGAEIHVMRPLDDSAASRVNEPGAWSLSSLSVSDPSSVAPFYESLFGWQAQESGPATLFRLPGYVGGAPEQHVPRGVVAVMKQADAAADAVWTPDFWVADADAAAEAATARGGQVVVEPEVTDTGFRTAVLADPGGARFSVSQPLDGD